MAEERQGETIDPDATSGDLEAEVMEDDIEREAEAQALVEGVHFGPAVSLGFPHFQAGLDARAGALGLSISYGYTPRRVRGTSLTLTNFEATVRSFPFLGAFYTGVSLGQQNLRASKRGPSGKSVIEKIESIYVTPHAGLQFHLTRGLFFAQELGFVLFSREQRDVSLLSTSESDGDRDTRTEVDSLVGRYGRDWMPYVNFLKAGYLF